ncbi:MAG: S66 peptidase family protein [Patescibacteria group bacterium]|nr:S66 peptidase family protein [Patescibacteria group bacterium]
MIETYTKPSRLQKGDRVGIVSPSSTIEPFPRRTDRGVKNLENIGLEVVFSSSAKKSFGHNAGTPQERANDINLMFSDESIKAIVCSTGGLNANAILPLLDYEIIKKNPKIFCGYSDITVLNNAITHKTGLVTFNGPTLLPTFGEYGGVNEYTLEYFKKALFSEVPIGIITSAAEYSDENLWWEKEDTRPSDMKEAEPMKPVLSGFAEGVLMGGNLNSLCFLGGTEYMPDFSDSILFLEDEEESTAYTERRLNYLEQIGVLGKTRGILFARPYQFITDSQDRTLIDILSFFGEKYEIPIICDIDFGHTNPMLTLPLGIRATMNVSANNARMELVESAVI